MMENHQEATLKLLLSEIADSASEGRRPVLMYVLQSIQ
jgi:hypothetical protein